MNKFIVKERRSVGTYRNPYRKGGRATRFTDWQTVSTHDSIQEAVSKICAVVSGASRWAIFHKGKQISDGPKLQEWWLLENPNWQRVECLKKRS